MEFWCVFLVALSLGVVSGSSIVIRSSDDSDANPWRQPLGARQFRQIGFTDDDPNPWRRQRVLGAVDEDPNPWRRQRVLGAVDDDPNNWRNQRAYSFPSFGKLPVFRLFTTTPKPNSGEDEKGFKTLGIGDDEGDSVIGCAPGFEKCIPRLGR